MGITAKATADTEPGTITGDAGDDRSDGFGSVDAAEHKQHDADEDDHHKDHEDDHHVGDDVRRNGFAVKPDGVDRLGVQAVAQYLAHVPHQYKYAHGFESARGGASHCTAEGQYNEEEGDGHPPLRGVGNKGAGSGYDADGLHQAIADGVAPAVAHGEDQCADYEQRGCDYGAEIEKELFEFVAEPIPTEGEEVEKQGKVDTAEEHGQCDDVLLQVGKTLEAVVVDGESARGDVGEGDVDSVPDVHTAFVEQEDEEEGKENVNAEGVTHGGAHG